MYNSIYASVLCAIRPGGVRSINPIYFEPEVSLTVYIFCIINVAMSATCLYAGVFTILLIGFTYYCSPLGITT